MILKEAIGYCRELRIAALEALEVIILEHLKIPALEQLQNTGETFSSRLNLAMSYCHVTCAV
jgi:hypothetical protein